MLISRLAPAVVGFVVLVGWASANAQQASKGPTAYIEELGHRVISVIQNSESESERMQQFREMFAQNFDVQAIAKFVIGRYWQSATPEQRQEYLEVFRDYVLAAYGSQFARYSGVTFQVLEQRALSGNDSLVTAQIIRPNEEPLRVSFRVRDTGGKFTIVDVAVEGVSLLVTKRSEFSSVISREGIDGLIARLKSQIQAT